MNLTYFLLNSIKYAKYTLSKNLIFLMCYHFIPRFTKHRVLLIQLRSFKYCGFGNLGMKDSNEYSEE